MKKFAVPLLVIAALAGLAIWGVLRQSGPQPAQTIACSDPMAGCSFMHRGVPASLRFSAQPEALKPFVLTLTAPNLNKASASFQMVGMDMGFNRYDLKPGADGVWSARITLPVCTVSRVDWIAELDLDGQLYSLTFSSR